MVEHTGPNMVGWQARVGKINQPMEWCVHVQLPAYHMYIVRTGYVRCIPHGCTFHGAVSAYVRASACRITWRIVGLRRPVCCHIEIRTVPPDG